MLDSDIVSEGDLLKVLEQYIEWRFLFIIYSCEKQIPVYLFDLKIIRY